MKKIEKEVLKEMEKYNPDELSPYWKGVLIGAIKLTHQKTAQAIFDTIKRRIKSMATDDNGWAIPERAIAKSELKIFIEELKKRWGCK